MAITLSIITRTVFGNKRAVLAKVNFDSSYATHGEALTPAALGLSNIDAVFCTAAAAAAGTTAVDVKWDPINQKLIAFGTGASSTAVNAEIASTTDLSLLTFTILALGA